MLGQCLNSGWSLMRDHRDNSAGRRKEGTVVGADDDRSLLTLSDTLPFDEAGKESEVTPSRSTDWEEGNGEDGKAVGGEDTDEGEVTVDAEEEEEVEEDRGADDGPVAAAEESRDGTGRGSSCLSASLALRAAVLVVSAVLVWLGGELVWVGGRSGMAGMLSGAVGSLVESTVGWSDCCDANASSGSGCAGREEAAADGMGANGTLRYTAGGGEAESDCRGGGEAVGLGAAEGTDGARADDSR